MENRTVIKTSLPALGAKIFLLDQTQTSVTGKAKPFTETTLTIEGPYAFKALQENSLTIDRCTLEMDYRTIMEKAPLWKVKKAVWSETGISEYWGYQPWVLKEKNVRSRTNETVLTFKFKVKDIPETIALGMETSDRYKIEINGKELDFTPGKWHIDRRIRVFNLAGNVVEGINTIRATTDFLWDTEIENIYILGDFAVGPAEEGFPILKEPETLNTGDWCPQGYQFYAGSILYKMEFSLEKDDAARYEIDLSGAAGCNFHVTVNETEVGSIPFSPFRGDITGALKNGENILEIEVAGSLRNILGPHHYKSSDNQESIKPEHFHVDADENDSYNFVPYGFLKPPKLVKII